MLLLSTKTNNKIVRTEKRTDGQMVCKSVFSITVDVSFWCSKEPSHREDSFAHQKCLSENIIVDLRIISKPTSKLNIKKWARVCPPAKCHLNCILFETKGPRVRASPASLRCVLEQDTLFQA